MMKQSDKIQNNEMFIESFSGEQQIKRVLFIILMFPFNWFPTSSVYNIHFFSCN